MLLVDVVPWVAIVGALASGLIICASPIDARPGIWKLPATLCILFLAWSLWAIATEGLFGFWVEHTRNKWGNQIWFDLVLGISVAWAILAPEAKRVGTRLLPWLALIFGTGCIGLLAMLARYLYLRDAQHQDMAGGHATSGQ